jgi:hypothetical protein
VPNVLIFIEFNFFILSAKCPIYPADLVLAEEALLAEAALVGLDAGMGAPVAVHVRLLAELHQADVADEHLAHKVPVRPQVGGHVLGHECRERARRALNIDFFLFNSFLSFFIIFSISFF